MDITVSKSVSEDFNKAETIKQKITRSIARQMYGENSNNFYGLHEFHKDALKYNLTKETDFNKYMENEHSAIYTAVFLAYNNL